MSLPEERRPARPAGITVLGGLLLAAGASWLGLGALAASEYPDQILTISSMVSLTCFCVLPALWSAATGVGLLGGQGWSRASFLAMAALAVALVAGMLSKPPGQGGEFYVRVGFVFSLALVFGGGAWLLFGAKGRAWFR